MLNAEIRTQFQRLRVRALELPLDRGAATTPDPSPAVPEAGGHHEAAAGRPSQGLRGRRPGGARVPGRPWFTVASSNLRCRPHVTFPLGVSVSHLGKTPVLVMIGFGANPTPGWPQLNSAHYTGSDPISKRWPHLEGPEAHGFRGHCSTQARLCHCRLGCVQVSPLPW